MLQPFKTNHGEENLSRIQSKACWLLTYLQLSGVRKDYRFFLLFVKGCLLNFLYCMKFRCFEGEENFQFFDSRITFAQNRYSLLICSVWILSNLFSFSCCLFDLYRDSKRSSTVCFYSASYHWKVCDGFTFNLPWLWYYIYHSIEQEWCFYKRIFIIINFLLVPGVFS